jgi:hypothetical protein
MKRVILMLVMMFTMGVYSFAENNNTVAVENVAKYDLKIDNRRLAVYLDLTADQMDAVTAVSNEFSNELKFAAVECTNTARKEVTKNAIIKNVKHMRYILNHEQMKKYLMVLNATVKNRGLE